MRFAIFMFHYVSVFLDSRHVFLTTGKTGSKNNAEWLATVVDISAQKAKHSGLVMLRHSRLRWPNNCAWWVVEITSPIYNKPYTSIWSRHFYTLVKPYTTLWLKMYSCTYWYCFFFEVVYIPIVFNPRPDYIRFLHFFISILHISFHTSQLKCDINQ